MGNRRLPLGIKDDEVAALALLGSTLAELSSSIMEHDNPPPSFSKRKTLIKVEKARRHVLTAVREWGRRVTESKKIFEEVERFIELRPDESLSPGQSVQWSKSAPQQEPQRPRPHVPPRRLRLGDSLCTSIVGLSAIAEGRDAEQDSPDSATDGSTASACDPPTEPAAARVSSDEQEPPSGAQEQRREPAGAGAGARLALGAIGVNSEGVLQRAAGQLGAAQAAGKGAAPLPQQQQLQAEAMGPPEDDGSRPVLAPEPADSSTSTTMCNMDSCVTGPPRGFTVRAAGGIRRRSDERYAGMEDDEEDEDEVNSAEGRRVVGSPAHRVSLLGPRPRDAPALTVACSSDSSAAPQTTSSPLDMNGLRAKYAALTRGGGEGGGEGEAPDAEAEALPPTLPPVAPPAAPDGQPPKQQQQQELPRSGPSNNNAGWAAADGAATDAPVTPGAGGEPGPSPSVRALAEALRSQESITANRSYIGFDPRHGQNDAAPPQGAATGRAPFTDETLPASAAAEGLDAIDPRAAAARQPVPAVAPRYPAARQPAAAHATQRVNSGPKPQSQPAAPGAHAHQLPDTAAAGSSSLPAAAYPQRHGHGPHHPAHVAAIAAAAAHPFTAHQHALPASGPSSLREFPVGRPAAAGAARYASQPTSAQQSLDSGRFPASATITNWDNASLADTEPIPGPAPTRRGRRHGRRRGGVFGLVRNVVGFVGVSVLSGAAMVLGAAAVNTGLEEQEEASQARTRGARRGQRLGRGGDELIPQGALQQLRSPDLLALGRG